MGSSEAACVGSFCDFVYSALRFFERWWCQNWRRIGKRCELILCTALLAVPVPLRQRVLRTGLLNAQTFGECIAQSAIGRTGVWWRYWVPILIAATSIRGGTTLKGGRTARKHTASKAGWTACFNCVGASIRATRIVVRTTKLAHMLTTNYSITRRTRTKMTRGPGEKDPISMARSAVPRDTTLT